MCTWMTSCETLPVPPFFNPPPIPHIVSFPTLSFGNLVFSLHASPLFTPLAVPLFFLSRGHNQRMEFLGDSIMQLVATEYLFIHFPDHHEGHLTVRSNHLKHSPKAFFPPAAMYFSHLPLLHPCLVFIPPSPPFYIIWGVVFLSPPSSLLINLWSSSFFFFFFNLFASTALFHSPPLMLCLYVYCTPRDGYCHETELFSGFQQHIFVGTFLQKLSSVWKIKSRVREPARLVPQVQSKWSHFEHASPFSDGVKQHCGAVFLVEHQHFSSEDPTAGGCKDRAGLKTE